MWSSDLFSGVQHNLKKTFVLCCSKRVRHRSSITSVFKVNVKQQFKTNTKNLHVLSTQGKRQMYVGSTSLFLEVISSSISQQTKANNHTGHKQTNYLPLPGHFIDPDLASANKNNLSEHISAAKIRVAGCDNTE